MEGNEKGTSLPRWEKSEGIFLQIRTEKLDAR